MAFIPGSASGADPVPGPAPDAAAAPTSLSPGEAQPRGPGDVPHQSQCHGQPDRVQSIRSDFLGPGPLPPGVRLYLVVLNYVLPAGLPHVWTKACFRICADGGCNRLHDELPGMVPPPPSHVAAAATATATATATAAAVAAAETQPPPAAVRVPCCGGSSGGAPPPSWPAQSSEPLGAGGGNGATAAAEADTKHGNNNGSRREGSSNGCNGHLPVTVSTGADPTATATTTVTTAVDPATALRLAHLPDVVLGDLDSLRPDVRQFYTSHGVPFVDLSYDQDTNDLTKAVQLIEDRFIRPAAAGSGAGAGTAGPGPGAPEPDPDPDHHQIVVVGALGGRLDHTLANLNTLHAFPHLAICLWGDGNLVRLVRPGSARMHPDRSYEGPTCGLIPMAGPVTATSTGLQWNLDRTTMRVGGLVSTSNLLAGDEVIVQADGPLLWSTELHAEPRTDAGELWARAAAAAAAAVQPVTTVAATAAGGGGDGQGAA
ncbi:hypothetical protein GPECTOR_3g341 [Gonium pectorale]|uniref:thiamine diphosphokinase n=1 Tax=Gonium pectorale TaxID=33097 RepID=A0A150GZ55_GONPE|nr:hypothetical protein GPECTOR_3g341 [Gonium pectorale]|eukprot:KXZ55197.1 hypothetical protein GPECTOR_3g341 [Gonium pectorale]